VSLRRKKEKGKMKKEMRCLFAFFVFLFFFFICLDGCKKKSGVPAKSSPQTTIILPATTRATGLEPEPARPVASKESEAKFAASAKPLVNNLIATTQKLSDGTTLGDFRSRIADLKKLLAAVADPPPESTPAQAVMSLIHDTLHDMDEAEQHWEKTVLDPQQAQKMTPEQLAAFAQRKAREEDYRYNCFQNAVKSTTQASKVLDGIQAKP
jgi:hypothetical protein